MSDLEIRQWNGRASMPTAEAEGNRLSGRAAPFMSPTMIGGVFREQINPKAFNRTLSDADVVLLDNHDSAKPLARMSAGTLELHEGRKGLDWSGHAVDTTYGLDVVKNVRAGNYGGCSFSFQVSPGGDSWDEDTPDGIPLRTLNDVNLREISIVTFPAYADTSVQARSMVEIAMEFRSRWYERELLEWHPDGERADNKPYGDVEYADPKNGKYPIDTKAHVKAAWAYINVAKNAAEYPLNGVTLSSVKAKIRAAAKKFNVDISDDDESNAELIVLDVREGLQITFDSALWDEASRSAYLGEEKWIRIPDDSEGEPSHLSKEEVADLSKRAADMRRQQYALRKARMASEGR